MTDIFKTIQFKRLFLLVLLSCLAFLIPIRPVEAAAQAIPSGIVIGDDKGIKVEADGVYLMDIEGILPGNEYETTVSLLNVDEKGGAYDLYFWIDPPTQIEGSINFAEAMTMKLMLDDKEIFDGKVSGIGNLDLQKEELLLGNLKPGDTKALKVQMKMSKDYTSKDYEFKSITENVWHFRAIRKDSPTEPEEPDGPDEPGGSTDGGKKPLIKFPQTGEGWRDTLLYSCIGLFLIVIILLIFKAKSDQKKREQEEEK